MFQLNHLSKIYKTGRTKVHALKNVSCKINQGEFVSVVGKSGCGKSTLLNLIGGLDRPTCGELFFHDQNLSSMTSNKLADYRKKEVGIIFQSFNLIYTHTALENVALSLAIGNIRRKDRSKIALDLLRKVGLEDRADHLPSELSGGESQRVAIARAMANNPKIILADEPTGNLDSQTAKQIMNLLADLNKTEKKTILLITHDLESATQHSDKLIHLKDGEIIKTE